MQNEAMEVIDETLYIRQQQTVADPLSRSASSRRSRSFWNTRRTEWKLHYARVSTSQQQHEGTIESQRRTLQHHIQHHGWRCCPSMSILMMDQRCPA